MKAKSCQENVFTCLKQSESHNRLEYKPSPSLKNITLKKTRIT